jgi:short-subunit dehydrogenase
MLATAPNTTTKRALIVTGASSGIGRALAIAAARDGFDVVICARRAARLEGLAAEIRSFGGGCAVVVADVRDAAAPNMLIAAALSQFGRIDVIANVAGMGSPGALLAQSDAAIEAQWQVHVAAPLRIARAALPHLRTTHGQLIFVGSGLARVPAPGFGAYAPAKAAIRAAAGQLRRELRGDDIAVTYVDPGAVDTEFSEAAGMERRAPSNLLAAADAVAARIVRSMRTRAARVNAVPWQTAGVVMGEWFPALADRAIARIVDAPPTAKSAVQPELALTLASVAPPASGGFDAALEPVARRMERVKLSQTFVRELLVPNATITLHEAAMRWAGMPNKNERAAMREVLDALATAGYLQPSGDESWIVLRAAG